MKSHTFANLVTLKTHKFGQWPQKFVKLYFIEFKGLDDIKIRRRVQNTY